MQKKIRRELNVANESCTRSTQGLCKGSKTMKITNEKLLATLIKLPHNTDVQASVSASNMCALLPLLAHV